MKRIIYLIAMLFCLLGCEKQEVNERVKFAKVSFGNKTAYDQAPYVMYDGKKIDPTVGIALAYGDREFAVYKKSGEKLLDTLLSITKSQGYYIYQPDTTKAAVLLTELPPPPPPPAGPLDNAVPIPDGFMQVKFINDSQVVLGSDKYDVEILSTVTTAGIYELVTTIRNVTADPGQNFVSFERPVRAGVRQTNFRFRFLKSDTKEPVKTGGGTVYQTNPLSIGVNSQNTFKAFAISITSFESGNAVTGVEKNGLYYSIGCRVAATK